MKPQKILTTDLAGIQYIGINGITSTCRTAIARLINSGEPLKNALLLTCESSHGFILVTDLDEVIAVKAGFSSGYAGEGSAGLALALALLDHHNVDVEEHEVMPSLMERLEYSCLLQSDIDMLNSANPVRPRRLYDYRHDYEEDFAEGPEKFRQLYPQSIPFGLIDARIKDLAISFNKNEDAAINSAYRRLEDTLRRRTGIAGEGVKLFSKAFLVEDAPLRWDVPDESEGKGRANLFIATYMAFRNARAHREIEPKYIAELREFLLINELFCLEAESVTEVELSKKRAEELEFEAIMRSLKTSNRS
jgi:hypothetical protein